MKIPALLLLCVTAGSLHAESWTPSEGLLGAVRRIESDDGRFTVGDQGRSLGDYQISEAAWCDVNAWRKARGLPAFDYGKHVWSESMSRTYAADYLQILREQLKKRLHRSPSAAELYAAYNMGMSSFARRQYRVGSTKASAPGKRLPIQTALLER
jgi:hypothetical protein